MVAVNFYTFQLTGLGLWLNMSLRLHPFLCLNFRLFWRLFFPLLHLQLMLHLQLIHPLQRRLSLWANGLPIKTLGNLSLGWLCQRSGKPSTSTISLIQQSVG
jgi:hypothetical protein